MNATPAQSIIDFVQSQRTLLPLTTLNYTTATTHEQPSPELLFQAITRRSTGEGMDNENLEVLGDSFLKLAVSMSLYYRYPLESAGVLTVEKTKQISNENLYRLAVLKKLKDYLYAKKIEFRGKNANWLPPGYMIDESEATEGDRYLQQNAKRKAFSDMVEALIGTFLISSNYTTTMEFMQWLGLDVIPLNETGKLALFDRSIILRFDSLQGQVLGVPSILRLNVLTATDEQTDRIVQSFFRNQAFSGIETRIKYEFRNKAYLIAAFTHPSSFANRVTDCYER